MRIEYFTLDGGRTLRRGLLLRAVDGRSRNADRAPWRPSDGPQLECVRQAAPQVSVCGARAGRAMKNGGLALCRKLISENGVVGLKVSAAELKQ